MNKTHETKQGYNWFSFKQWQNSKYKTENMYNLEGKKEPKHPSISQ